MGPALITTGSQYNCLLRKATEYFAIASLTFSFYTFVLASVNRYLQIKKPNIINSSFHLTIALTGFMVLANVTSTMALLYPSFYSRLIFNIFWSCPYLSILVIYCSLLKQMRVHAVRIHVEDNSEQRISPDQNQGMNQESQNSSENTVDRNKMLTKSKYLMVGLILVLSLPYNVISLFWSYYALHNRVYPGLYLNILHRASWIFIAINMSANGILFILLNRGVRRCLKRLLLF